MSYLGSRSLDGEHTFPFKYKFHQLLSTLVSMGGGGHYIDIGGHGSGIGIARGSLCPSGLSIVDSFTTSDLYDSTVSLVFSTNKLSLHQYLVKYQECRVRHMTHYDLTLSILFFKLTEYFIYFKNLLLFFSFLTYL